MLSTQTVSVAVQLVVSGGGVTTGGVVVVVRVHGGGVKVGHGLQSGKHLQLLH